MTLFGYCNDEGKDKHRVELESTNVENLEQSITADITDDTERVTVTPTNAATTPFLTPSPSPSSTAMPKVEADTNGEGSTTIPSSKPLNTNKPESFTTTVSSITTSFAKPSISSILHNQSSLNEQVNQQVTDVSNTGLSSSVVLEGDLGQLIFGLYASLVLLLQGWAFLYLFPNLIIQLNVIAFLNKALNYLITINDFL